MQVGTNEAPVREIKWVNLADSGNFSFLVSLPVRNFVFRSNPSASFPAWELLCWGTYRICREKRRFF